ncbi:MAG: carbohydrate ABC transporter permease [Clostridiales bacterium]|jgi:multiple sugar transport system permease protein|nr:carbohydrate ABC transporter permease [Clostridiales bacterium]
MNRRGGTDKSERRTVRGLTSPSAFLALMSVLLALPLAVTVTNSFMTEMEISLRYTDKLSVFDIAEGIKEKFTSIALLPNEVTLDQYAEVLVNQPSFMLLLVNSVKITLPVVLGGLVVSLLGAYGFRVWRWRFKEAVFFAYIVVMLMPLQAVLVPNYIMADILKIKDSSLYLAIILPGIFSPFGTFLLRQSMKGLPEANLEAARIDGAGEWYIFCRVVLPQMRSGIAAYMMLTFIEYWNIVEQAVIFIKDYTKEPLSVYLSRIADGRISLVFAASCVYMFPPLWMLIVGQKDLEKGIELSGIK